MWLLNYILPVSEITLIAHVPHLASPCIQLLGRLALEVEPPDWKKKLNNFVWLKLLINNSDWTHRKWISPGRRLFHLDRETSTSCLERGTGAKPALSTVSSARILMSFLTSDFVAMYYAQLARVTSQHHQLDKYLKNKLQIVKLSFGKFCKNILLLYWKYLNF